MKYSPSRMIILFISTALLIACSSKSGLGPEEGSSNPSLEGTWRGNRTQIYCGDRRVDLPVLSNPSAQDALVIFSRGQFTERTGEREFLGTYSSTSSQISVEYAEDLDRVTLNYIWLGSQLGIENETALEEGCHRFGLEGPGYFIFDRV